jgi:hypothetical protein
MRLRRPLFSISAGLLALALLADCHCEGDPLSQHNPGSCEPTFKCQMGFDYRLGTCKQSRCLIDSDCCPGQKCNAAAGFCADQWVACTDDTSCTEVQGQRCIDFRGGKFCGYPNKGHSLGTHQTQGCVTTADCDEGRTCFGGRCVFNAPCKGGCGSGSICDIDSDTCFDMPSCTAQCADGQMKIVADPDTQSGAHCCKVDCKCETLPPVRPGQYGYYASLGITRDDVVVSAYDQTYGDLVLAHFGSMDGKLTRLEYIDGYPSSGAIVANPNGPRGGRADPGPDVGQHTSIAVDAQNVVHIAYYDKTNGQLRYINNAGGKWNPSVVDADGNVGYYTSIAIGPDGNPRIAYMLVEGTRPPDQTKITALKYAVAHSPAPSSPTDWTTAYVDARAKPLPPCDGACPMGQACIDQMGMGGPQCVNEEMGCMPACGTNQACIDRQGAPTCVDKIPLLPIDDLVPGTGLFASLAITSTGTPKIAYYDRVDGDLKLAVGGANDAFSVVTLDGNDPMSPSDVGQHASLAIDPNGVVAIAYVDVTKTDLVYLELTPGAAPVREVVDNGVSAPDIRMVGPDASLLFDSNGNPAIAYQDPTNIDLLYARRTGSPPMWSTEVLKGGVPGAGTMMMGMMPKGTASGFYASQKRLDTKAYVSNVDVSFDVEGNLLLKLTVVLKDLL